MEHLCSISHEYEMYKNKDLPQPVWDYIRKAGFLGMIIDKQYGGKGFSAHGHALVVQKLSTRSQSVGVSVMVPNSLGPGELLKRYGTQVSCDRDGDWDWGGLLVLGWGQDGRARLAQSTPTDD